MMQPKNLYRLTALLLWLFSSPHLAFAAIERYTNNKDGTVLDNSTGLIWIKDPDLIAETRGSLLWLKGKTACAELQYAGAGPGAWRLPNVDELQTIISDGSSAPRLDLTKFNGVSSPYWTSTMYVGPGASVWLVDFSNGQLITRRKLNLTTPEYHRVRCVRNAAV